MRNEIPSILPEPIFFRNNFWLMFQMIIRDRVRSRFRNFSRQDFAEFKIRNVSKIPFWKFGWMETKFWIPVLNKSQNLSLIQVFS
jgi:hypothetical protein